MTSSFTWPTMIKMVKMTMEMITLNEKNMDKGELTSFCGRIELASCYGSEQNNSLQYGRVKMPTNTASKYKKRNFSKIAKQIRLKLKICTTLYA